MVQQSVCKNSFNVYITILALPLLVTVRVYLKDVHRPLVFNSPLDIVYLPFGVKSKEILFTWKTIRKCAN